MKLTASQLAEYEREGYLSIPHRLIEDDHLAALRDEYDALMSARPAGMNNIARVSQDEKEGRAEASEQMYQITEMWTRSDLFKRLLYHPPLLDIAESVVGPNIQLFHDQALYKPAHHGGEVPWHQDNAYWRCDPPNLASIWIALDDADEENGCMNVIPRSHRNGAAGHAPADATRGDQGPLLTATVDAQLAVAVPVKAGHAMTHHCQTLHQTNPNRSARQRRAMVIHYMAAGTKNRNGEPMAKNLILRGVLDGKGPELP